MAAKQFFIPHLTATVAGIAQPGARFYFYTTGTLTPESIFSDSGLSVERTNPVVCDASGALPVTYLDNTKTYRVRICDKNDVLLSGGDIDPFIPGVFPDAAVLQPYQDAAEAAATEAAASATAAATSATNASTSEDNASDSATAAASSATAASASASAASSSASAAADSATAASASASAAATSASAADSSADDAAASAAAAAAAVVPVPTGGSSGQVLSKASASDFDTEWADAAGGLSDIIDVRDYGYVADYDGSTGTDNATAIANAIAAAEAAATNAGYGSGSNYRGAPTIIFPSGWAYTSATIEPLCTLTLQGQGGIGTGASTRIAFAEDIDGIRTQAYNTSGESSTRAGGQSGADIMLRGIRFEGGSLSGGADGDYHGLHLRAQCVAYDCTFVGFQGEGLYSIATATAGGAGEGNANCSKFFNCHFHLNRNGVLLNGADTNAFLFSGCHADGNRSWGFDDQSFLGNTFVACHTQSNTDGPYRTTGASATSVFIGCYSETGQPTSSFSAPTLIFGGQHGAGVSGGTYMHAGASATQLDASNNVLSVKSSIEAKDGSGYGNVYLGDAGRIGGGGGYLTYVSNSGNHRFYGTGTATIADINDTGLALVATKTIAVNGVTVVNGSGVLQAAAFPAFTGDVTTSAGAIATTIANNAVSFAKFVAAGSAGFVGATGAGNYSHRTPTQVTAALDAMVGDSGSGGTKGLVPAPASGDSSKYLKGDGTWAAVGSDPWTYAFVASDVTNNTTTPSNVTGLSFTPAASKKYEFEAFLSLTSAATTTGAQVGLTWPSGSTFSMAAIQIQSGAITVNETGGDATAELVCSVTAAPSATASFPGKIKGTITMGGSPSGSVQVRIRSEVGSSQVAVKAGSWIKYREIS